MTPTGNDLAMPDADYVDLYHYPSPRHLPRILRAGLLTTTESNLSGVREHAGPDVVWLTTDASPTDPDAHGLLNRVCDKTAVRITVAPPRADVHDWLDWSRRRGITKRWAARLEDGRAADTWGVVPRAIPSEEWVSVEERAESGWRVPAGVHLTDTFPVAQGA